MVLGFAILPYTLSGLWVYLQQSTGGSNIDNSRAPLWVLHMDFEGLLHFYLELPVEHFFAGSKVVLFIAAAAPFVCFASVPLSISIFVVCPFDLILSWRERLYPYCKSASGLICVQIFNCNILS